MKLKAALQGNLKKHMRREYKRAEYAVTRAVTDASYGLKMNMRRQVLSAGLGRRLANTWRDAVYPKGTISTRAAAVVYTRASKIMEGFDQGTTIRSKDGFWLAIPTPNAPKRIMGKKTTPANFEKARGIRLQFVYRKNGPSLLIAKDMQPSYKRTLRTGRGHTSVVMFWLVPQVKMPKHLSFKKEAEKWNGKIPQFILRYWPDEK
jgi:hypothetical protein